MIIVGVRQDKHGMHCDREELSKAGAGLVERDVDETHMYTEAIATANATQQLLVGRDDDTRRLR